MSKINKLIGNMNIPERRCFRRFPFASNGCVMVNGVDVDIRTHDISQGGALVEFNTAPHLVADGMSFPVYLNAGFIGSATVCQRAVSKNCVLYGLKFDRFDFRTGQVLAEFLVRLEAYPLNIPAIH